MVELTTVEMEGMSVQKGDLIQLNAITLSPGDGLVLKLIQTEKESREMEKEEL